MSESENKKTPPRSVVELLERYAAGERDFTDVELEGADLRGAELVGVDLSHARLSGSDLREANLGGATLFEAVLENADLRNADLSGSFLPLAVLNGANLSGTNLQNCDFSEADLIGCHINNADLTSATLNAAKIYESSFGGVDLSSVEFMDTFFDIAGNFISVDTLLFTSTGLAEYPSNQSAVEMFFRACGVQEHAIAYFRSLIGKPIEFYSAFISYSSKDRPFAERLYEALQVRGIRCWLDNKDILPGDNIRDAIDRGIRLWDKVILVCSEHSLTSRWVDREIERALRKEERIQTEDGRRVHALVPITLDNFVHKGWTSGKRDDVFDKKVGDFTEWKNHDSFEKALEGLISALRADENARPEPPKPKL